MKWFQVKNIIILLSWLVHFKGSGKNTAPYGNNYILLYRILQLHIGNNN